MATLAELAENVLIPVTGGHLTHDANVLRADILAYLRVAILRYNTIGMRERRAEARLDISSGLASEWADGTYFGTYQVTPTLGDHGIKFADLPGAVQSLHNNRGILSVAYLNAPLQPFVKASNPYQLIGTERFWGSQVFFSTTTSNGKTRLVIFNSSDDCDIEVVALMDPKDLQDDDQAPIIPEMIEPLIDHTIEHFMAQRGQIADDAIDAADTNQKR